MSTKPYKSGDILDYANSGSAIAVSDIVVIGDLVGMALAAIAASATGPVLVRGVVQVVKATSQTWTQGQTVYYDSGSANFTTTATGNVRAGVAAIAAGSSAATGYVSLNAGPGVDIGVQGAHIADPTSAAALTQDSLTDSTTGVAATTLAACTNIDTIGGTLTGTLDNTLADIGNTTSSDGSAAVNKNFKEIQAELVTQKALNTAVVNAIASLAAQLAKVKTDVAAVRTGSEANNTAIDSILAALEAFKVVAAS